MQEYHFSVIDVIVYYYSIMIKSNDLVLSEFISHEDQQILAQHL